MKSVSCAIAAIFLYLAVASAQQPSGTPAPAPASGAASSCPPATPSGANCPAQVTINNNPAPTPSPSPSPQPRKGPAQLRLVALKYDKDKCPCPDAKKTAAIAKTLDSIVPGAHVTAADAGILAIVWDDSVSPKAVDNLADLAQQLFDSKQAPLPDSPAAPKSPLIKRLNNHKAQEIANKVAASVPGITVAAIPNDTDDALVITWDKDPLAAAVADLLKIIDGLDAADTAGYASSHIIRLYNNRQATDIAKKLNSFQFGSQKITVTNQGEDLLILTGSAPGSEAAIDELKRYIAVMDLPRPQLALNLWSVQISSGKRDEVTNDSEDVRRIVNSYNSVLAESYDRGWAVITYLKDHTNSHQPEWLDKSFSDYIGKRFISCSPFYATGGAPTQLCLAEDDPTHKKELPNRTFLHACAKGQYCLGYTFAFDPLKASLTNLFFVLAAADRPAAVAASVVECMQSNSPQCGQRKGQDLLENVLKISPKTQEGGKTCKFDLEPEAGCQPAVKQDTTPDTNLASRERECAASDLDQYTLDLASPDSELMPRRLHFECFAAELQNVFGSSRRTGLTRAAIADFLFHYKMSVEYPHDFVPYDLSHSADTLDSWFHPLLAAYNQDLAALLQALRGWRSLTTKQFKSEGIVSVSVISGNPASVDAKTANSFESTTPFTIAEFLNQLKAAESSTPALLKNNLSAEEANAIVAAFNVQKPTNISIGRDLSLTATAFSLATGSAADLKVTMAAKDDGQPQQTFPSSGTKNDINPSRVASHTVDTTVRVESTKLFELSTLSAELTYRGNSVPVPVVGELPWIGPAFRWPGKVHKVFHRSFAIISAVIVPNAADLAEGMPFTTDRILAIPAPVAKPCQEPAPPKCPAGTCVEPQKKCPVPPDRQPEIGATSREFSNQYHVKTLSLDSLHELPPQVREFHKEKLRCFISNDSLATCGSLNFENFPEDGRPGDKNAEEP
jgi:hypothetical protein